MRIWMASIVCFFGAGLAQAADPGPAKSDESTLATTMREDHLRLAVESLRSIGLNEDADRVARRAQGTNHTPLQRLAEARLALDRTLDEIRQLEEETGFSQGIELRVRCIEVATADLELLQLRSKPGEQSLVMEEARAAELVRLLEEMGKAAKAKTLAETSLLTRNGRPVTMMAGGQFPIMVPADGGKVTVQHIDFGNRIEALAQILESRRVRVDIAFENSERDISRSAEASGFVIPGVRRCKLNTQFEVGFGETVLWLINVPSPESLAKCDAPKPDGKALAGAELEENAKVAERLVPRTAILLVRAERVAVATAGAGPAP